MVFVVFKVLVCDHKSGFMAIKREIARIGLDQIDYRVSKKGKIQKTKRYQSWGAAIAQWIRLLLPSCHPGFESQAHHLSFYKFIIVLCGKDENKRKRVRDWPIFLKKVKVCNSYFCKTFIRLSVHSF